MRSVPERRHIVSLALAGLLSAAPMPALPESMEPGDLESLQREIDTTRERQLELEEQAAAARADAEALRRRLIDTAARVQSFEADVSDSETRLAGLQGAEAVLNAQLEQRRGEMADLLAALSRLDRHPPPALAARPDDALASLRSALLLGAVVPELQADARELRDRLEQLAALRQSILDERVTLEESQTSLEAERRELQALLDRQLERQTRLTREAESEQARADGLSRQATDLSDLISRLEAGAANRLPAARPDPAMPPAAQPKPAGPPPGTKEAETRDYAMLRPPAAAPAMPSSRRFSDAKGFIRPPAAGVHNR